MDRLTALLDGPRARGAFLLRGLLDPPWGITIRDEAPLTLVVVIRGTAWVRQAGGAVPVPEGSCAVIVGPEHYDVASDPDLRPGIVIHPGQRCETTDGASLELSMRLGVRSWGDRADASTVLLIGTYEHLASVAHGVLRDLPSPLVVARPDDDPLSAIVAREVLTDAPGQQTLLDRLLDALTVDTLRRWYVDHEADAPAWWGSHRDPIVGGALRLIHDRPAEPWTIATLAREVGTSRANLARRFGDRVGEPVVGYLTAWRMTLAADLLGEPGRSIAQVAQQVGYANPFAFSTAFKRHHGVSPNEHRRIVRVASTA